ncbi:hypothetical protein CCYA_CCYA16G4191 [Cyanidiococcus yangmingshanensis]|nr:hypothetical protein CCYA_CCYA16G4191 [Cyanidiococcus yangmingshanensis]
MLTRPPTRVGLEPLDLEALDRAIQKRHQDAGSAALRGDQMSNLNTAQTVPRSEAPSGVARSSTAAPPRGSLTTRQRIGLD